MYVLQAKKKSVEFARPNAQTTNSLMLKEIATPVPSTNTLLMDDANVSVAQGTLVPRDVKLDVRATLSWLVINVWSALSTLFAMSNSEFVCVLMASGNLVTMSASPMLSLLLNVMLANTMTATKAVWHVHLIVKHARIRLISV